MSIYRHPEAYELAFAYRDVDSQVDFIESRIEKYSKDKAGGRRPDR